MSKDLTPIDALVEIQKIKYKATIIPFGFVAVSFILSSALGIEWGKYFSIFALILYFFVQMIHRVNKHITNEGEDALFSPVNGEVISIKVENNVTEIEIKKGIFDRSDIRYCFTEGMTFDRNRLSNVDKTIDVKFDKDLKILSLSRRSNTLGMIFGISPSINLCSMKVSKPVNIKIEKGDKVIAGETILGEWVEKI